MRSLNLAVVFALVISALACSTSADLTKEQSTLPDEHHQLDDDETYDIMLDNVYLSRTLGAISFSAGFTIDGGGINTPVISIDTHNGSIRNYISEEIVTDFFYYNATITAALLSGKTLFFQKGEWVAGDLELPPDSTIVFTNNGNIIACSPRSPLKASNAQGSCTSRNPNWHTEIPWRTITPKICDDNIYAIVKLKNVEEYWEISRLDGKVITRDARKAATACVRGL